MDVYPSWPNLPTLMFARAREWPDRPMLRHFEAGSWHSMDWANFARRAASLARGLRAAGIAAGDRVLLVSESRPEVPIVETALMAIRAVPVPGYTVNTVHDHAHLLSDSGARVAIVSTVALAEKVTAAASLAGGLDLLLCMEAGPHAPLAPLLADPAPPDDIAAEAELIDRGALACLLYTSGTSGPPRGVMLPHRAMLANCEGAFELIRPLHFDRETYLSFLPLSHSFEHTVGQFFLLSMGSEIVYARGIEHLAADLQTIQPTVLALVPRVLDVIHSRILAQIKREKPFKRALFEQALQSGLRRLDGTATMWDRLADPVLDRLVRRRVRQRFGGRFRVGISGGARLDPDVGRFFLAMGLMFIQGYGQTEAGPVISANPPLRPKVHTVGLPLEGVALRLAEDGEITVRGELVMDGYWRQPEATRAAIVDGWLHTGDVGRLDEDGYLEITDRKKDIIVLSGGENVSPARVEGALMGESEILQAVVYGDGDTGLSAYIVPAENETPESVAAAVARVGARLSVTERVRRHTLVPPFTVDNGLLTASYKIRRSLVLRAHAAAREPAT
ncbi:MAG: AMP-dependent synthetase/ligase [Acetobacteraceae bacterium]|nr:AMP-dependent synthetase/ligase [Acetobacteraceae bacterium]